MQKINKVIKWDWNPLWHIVSNDKCLPTTKKPKLPWSHSFKKVEVIAHNLLRRKTPFKSVPCEVRLVKVFFLHPLDNNVSCACCHDPSFGLVTKARA